MERQTSVALSPTLSGLYCLGLIVLRDGENHNRRRAGELQSNGERAKGEEEQLLFKGRRVKKKKCQARSVGVLWDGGQRGERRGFRGTDP